MPLPADVKPAGYSDSNPATCSDLIRKIVGGSDHRFQLRHRYRRPSCKPSPFQNLLVATRTDQKDQTIATDPTAPFAGVEILTPSRRRLHGRRGEASGQSGIFVHGSELARGLRFQLLELIDPSQT
jgi:hypothetical protein